MAVLFERWRTPVRAVYRLRWLRESTVCGIGRNLARGEAARLQVAGLRLAAGQWVETVPWTGRSSRAMGSVGRVLTTVPGTGMKREP